MTSTIFPVRLRTRLEWPLLILIVLAAFLVRLWGITHMHSWDENVFLQNALLICCGKDNYNEIDSRPPLLSLLFAAVFKLWNSDYAAWCLTAFLNALEPLFLYLAGRKIAGKRAAFLAALLLAFTPFLVGVFPDASTGFLSDPTGFGLFTDCPALTCILLAYWLLLRAMERETWPRFGLAGIAMALAVLMRFGSLSSVGMIGLLAFCAHRRTRAVAGTILGFLLGMAPYLIWSRIAYGGFLYTFKSGWDNFAGESESPFYFLEWSGVIFSWIALAGLALWLARFVWETRFQRDHENRLIAASGFLGRDSRLWQAHLWAWAIACFLFFSSLSHKEPRYILPVAPPVFLLAGIGLCTLLVSRQRVLRFAGPALLATALIATFWPDRHRFDDGFFDNSRSEEMDVADWLTRNVPPSTTLYCDMNYPDYAYYTQFKVEVLPESGPPLYDALDRLSGNGIVIAYIVDDSNQPKEPSLAWLDRNPYFHRLKEFPTLVLYQHRATPSK